MKSRWYNKNMNDNEKMVAKENLESKESGEKNYEFITETIKKRPKNKKKILGKIVLTLFLALLFGVVSSITIAFVYPEICRRFLPEEAKPVTIPVAEETAEEPIEEFVPSEEDEYEVDNKDTEEETDWQKDKDSVETTVDSEDKAEKEVVVNQVVETIEKELELDDYRTLYRKISSVGNSVLKSMVKVSGVSTTTDWFNNKYDENIPVSGVIVADNGKELLIVTMADVLADAEEIEVTFCDGKTYKSKIKKTDSATGISIVGVDLNAMDQTTKDKIEMATFGSLSSMMSGTPVLAIGSPQGISDSMALGQITSSATVDITDGSVRVLSTDIYGSISASGVIANLNGRIIGFVCHEQLGTDMPNLIRAYSIVDLKDKIEKISNEQNLAMLGIIGTDVTESAYNELGVPFGTYVKRVDIDSPAMDAGIRSGDVIVKYGASDINSFTDYKEALLKSQPGDSVDITLMRPGRDKYTEITYQVNLGSL